jgi:putative phage-type endonuclease
VKILKAPQGSSAWLQARIGLVTASRMVDVMDYLKKGGEGAGRRNYRTELIAERLTNRSEDHYVSPEMEFGSEYEPFARAAYEIAQDVMVDQVGMVYHPTIERSSASPDGLVGDDKCIEIKVPKTANHLKWMQAGIVPAEHQDQCLWVMACAERQFCDFISFDPRLPEGLRIFCVRMARDEERIARMEEEVRKFDAEVTAAVDVLMQRVVKVPELPADTRSPYEQCMALADLIEMTP